MFINLHKVMLTFNTSLILMLFLSMFFFQKVSTYVMPGLKYNLSAWGIIHKKNFSWIKKKKLFFIGLLKTLAILSTIPLCIAAFLKFPNMVISFDKWLNLKAFSLKLEFCYDFKFNMFFSVALMVSSSIMEFSHYYMETDPKKNNFFRLLIMFLLKMVILTSTNKLFLLFMGWEGVGFLSFLLIGWWQTRSNAKKAAIQAVMYNRIGDIGMLLFFALIMVNFKTWSLSEINNMNTPTFPKTPLMLAGALMAAAGKSAQFGLHPWLPAAMEGPTPVSALLHSSTMVVAGMFLLMRISPLYVSFPTFNKWCLMLGSITALFAATTAISQHDMKKIVAYSTTSQLGLMMVAMGLNQPNIALFHMCTHAFFKAMLFLSSGSVIHSFNDEQDLRKMGGIFFILPNTSACMLLGSLALTGTPFLAGFYSKDLMLEISLSSLSNMTSMTFSLLATLLTMVYSLRMVFFCFSSSSKFYPLSPTSEEKTNLVKALNRLALGTITSGWFIATFILFAPPIKILIMLKLLALMVTACALVYSLPFLSMFSSSLFSAKYFIVKMFTSSQWFYEKVTHFFLSNISFLASLTLSSRNMDQGWKETIGAQGISRTTLEVSQIYQHSQTGYMKHYLVLSSTIFLTMVLTIFLFLAP